MTEEETLALEVLAELREMRAEMATKTDFAGIAGIKADFNEFRSELRQGFVEIRANLKAMGDRFCKEFEDIRRELDDIRREVEGWER